MSRTRFDAAYYRRFYAGETRVHGPREIAHLARAVCGMAGWLGVELRSVLDVGAGTGLWKRWFRRNRPAVPYRTIDVSRHACAAYGHERRDISSWRSPRRYDLVICQSVLQYLDDAAAERAVENLGAMCRGLLYLEAITTEDLAVLDAGATDLSIQVRPASWYRARLDRWFVQIGAGLWASARSGVRLYALEGGAGAARSDPPPGLASTGSRR